MLGTLAPPDAERGLEAAAAIRHGRRRNSTPQAFDAALSYAIGGKGLFDWTWTPASVARLDQVAARVRHALRLRPVA